MFDLLLGLTARTYYFVRRFMPTNIILDALHTRRGLKWGLPAMLLAAPYALAMVACVGSVERGGPGWLNVLAVLFAWNAVKFLIAGPVTVIRLLVARTGEARMRRKSTPPVVSIGGDQTRATKPVVLRTRV